MSSTTPSLPRFAEAEPSRAVSITAATPASRPEMA